MPPSSKLGMAICSGPQDGSDATGAGAACPCLAERGGGETRGEQAPPDDFTAALYTPLRTCPTQKPRRAQALGHPPPAGRQGWAVIIGGAGLVCASEDGLCPRPLPRPSTRRRAQACEHRPHSNPKAQAAHCRALPQAIEPQERRKGREGRGPLYIKGEADIFKRLNTLSLDTSALSLSERAWT